MAAVVDAGKCIGCGACQATCPVAAISLGDSSIAEVDAGACIGCGSCVDGCPAEAITLE